MAAEVGVPGFDTTAWQMLVAPGNTPRPVLEKLNVEVNAAVQTEEITKQFVTVGLRKFLAELLAHRQVRALLSDDHFSVDGTQVQAWASMKSFVAKDGSGDPPSPGRNGERHFPIRHGVSASKNAPSLNCGGVAS